MLSGNFSNFASYLTEYQKCTSKNVAINRFFKKNGMSIFYQHTQEESEAITIPVTQSLASSPERKVAQILGPEVFEGISGGLDTLGEIIAQSFIMYGISCKTK